MAEKSKTPKTEESSKHVNLEKAFDELEEIIAKLESDSIPLRESIELYGKGAKLVAGCRQELDGIEKEMIVIEENFATDEKE
ncbi:MAG: exodeoxyribonuclease VII small subunit [Clostridium sp.]|nr:exodeoxyribonuclease VII small subunit [Clostridium sp.]